MTSPAKLYHMTQVILWMWSYGQSLVNLAFLWEVIIKPQFYNYLTRKTTFFEGWSWFKFSNLGLALGITLKFYTSVARRLKLKFRKFWGAKSYVCRSYRGKTSSGEGGAFCTTKSWIGLHNLFLNSCLDKWWRHKL